MSTFCVEPCRFWVFFKEIVGVHLRTLLHIHIQVDRFKVALFKGSAFDTGLQGFRLRV